MNSSDRESRLKHQLSAKDQREMREISAHISELRAELARLNTGSYTAQRPSRLSVSPSRVHRLGPVRRSTSAHYNTPASNISHSPVRRTSSSSSGSSSSHSPVRRASPSRMHASPSRMHASPSRMHASPSRMHASPSRMHASPSHRRHSPVRHSSPSHRHHSPMRRHSPMRHSSPVRRSELQSPRPYSPVRRSELQSPRPYSPVRRSELQSPRPYSPVRRFDVKPMPSRHHTAVRRFSPMSSSSPMSSYPSRETLTRLNDSRRPSHSSFFRTESENYDMYN